jgi:phosphatidylserine/phosphatidylglycerophosphate/cardiolipin synthase-like enzyme
LLALTQSSLAFTVYSVSAGAADVFGDICECLSRGVRCRIAVNDFYNSPETRRFCAALHSVTGGDLSVFDVPPHGEGFSVGLHSKLFVFDYAHALISSSNLSFNGLVQTHELGVVLHGIHAEDVGAAFDDLIGSAEARRVNL